MTQLLFQTAALLRKVYDEPEPINMNGEPERRTVRPPGNAKGGSDDEYVHRTHVSTCADTRRFAPLSFEAGSELEADASPLTVADLDTFETLLNQDRTTHDRPINAVSQAQHAHGTTDIQVYSGVGPRKHNDTREEKEMEGSIKWTLPHQQEESLQLNTDPTTQQDLSRTMISAKESENNHPRRVDSPLQSADPPKQSNAHPKPAGPAARSTQKPSKEEQKAAENSAFIAGFYTGSSTWPKAHRAPVAQTASNVPRAPPPHERAVSSRVDVSGPSLKGDPERLAVSSIGTQVFERY